MNDNDFRFTVAAYSFTSIRSALLILDWVSRHGIDAEVELSGDEEEYGSHGVEAGASAGA